MKILSAFLLTSFFCTQLFSAELKTIRLATYLEPPYSDFKDGQYTGVNLTIIQLFAKKLNKTITYVRCPFARCLSLLKNNGADIVLGIRKTTKRAEFLSYLPEPFYIQYFPLLFFMRKNDEMKIEKYDDLKKLTIGTLRGASYFEPFDHDESLTKVELINYTQLIQLLLKGRIDTFLEREESLAPWIDADVYQNEIKLAHYQFNKAIGSYIAIAKNSALHAELNAFAAMQQTLLDNGEIDALLANKAEEKSN
jgi:polar amino acid transport system substrate-binding protein